MSAYLVHIVLVLLLACGLVFLSRRKFQDLGTTYNVVSHWLGVGIFILLIGITLYYS
jgi:preprotein translocase subunit SecG